METNQSEPKPGNDKPLDLIWGASAIGAEIKKSKRETFYFLERGLIPARKIGRQWVTSRAALLQHFFGEVA